MSKILIPKQLKIVINRLKVLLIKQFDSVFVVLTSSNFVH